MRNLLMQYFTPVPYGFICQIKRREKNTEPWRQQRFGLQDHCDTQSTGKSEKRGKKPNKKWNETEKETIISKVYHLKGARGNDNILHMNRRAFWSGSWSVSVWVCLCTNIQLKAINSSGNNKIVILKQEKRWNISKENILGFSNIRW